MTGSPAVVVPPGEHPVEKTPVSAAGRAFDAEEGRIQIFARFPVMLLAVEEAENPQIAPVALSPHNDTAQPELPPVPVAEPFVPRGQSAEGPVFGEIDLRAEALHQKFPPGGDRLRRFRRRHFDSERGGVLRDLPLLRNDRFPLFLLLFPAVAGIPGGQRPLQPDQRLPQLIQRIAVGLRPPDPGNAALLKCEQGAEVALFVFQRHTAHFPAVREASAERGVTVVRQYRGPFPGFKPSDLQNRRGRKRAVSAPGDQRPDLPSPDTPLAALIADETEQGPPEQTLVGSLLMEKLQQTDLELFRPGGAVVYREKAVPECLIPVLPPDRTELPQTLRIATEQRKHAELTAAGDPPDRAGHEKLPELPDDGEYAEAPAFGVPPHRTVQLKVAELPAQREQAEVSVSGVPPHRPCHAKLPEPPDGGEYAETPVFGVPPHRAVQLKVVELPAQRKQAEISTSGVPPHRTVQLEGGDMPGDGKQAELLPRPPDRTGKPDASALPVRRGEEEKVTMRAGPPDERADIVKITGVEQRKHAAGSPAPVGRKRPAAVRIPAGERPEYRGGILILMVEGAHREAAAVQIEKRPEYRSEIVTVVIERPEVDGFAVETDFHLLPGERAAQCAAAADAARAREQEK